jgi:hypothetical protein
LAMGSHRSCSLTSMSISSPRSIPPLLSSGGEGSPEPGLFSSEWGDCGTPSSSCFGGDDIMYGERGASGLLGC